MPDPDKAMTTIEYFWLYSLVLAFLTGMAAFCTIFFWFPLLSYVYHYWYP